MNRPARLALPAAAALLFVCMTAARAATWSGAGANANWSTSGNWDALPVDGDPLTFAGTTKQTNTNDLLTSVGTVTFSSANWNITGNAVTLGGNMTLSANGTVTWGLDTSLSATRTLNADNGRTLVLSGVLSGAGGLNGVGSYNNDGTIRLSGTANTFDGQVNAASTRLEVTKLADGGQPSSVGDGSSEIVIGSAISGAPGILSYIGTTDSSTNRRPRLLNWGSYGAVLRNDSPNNSNLGFTSATDWYLGWRDNDATLRLQGTSTGTSLIAGNLSDSDYTAGKKNHVLVDTAGTWVLSGNNSYTGTTTISNGTLQIGAGGASGTLGSGIVTNNGRLVFNRSDALLVSAQIEGAGTLHVNGPGTVTLSGTNGYTGTTHVAAGTLLIDGDHNAAGRIDVSAGSTLGGGGAGGIVQVAGGGVLAPGGADNHLALASLAMDPAAELRLELDMPSTDANFYNDHIAVTGDALLAGSLKLSARTGGIGFDFSTAAPGEKWRVLTHGGALDVSGLVIDQGSAPALASGLVWALDTTTQSGHLYLTVAIPEPAAGMLLLTGLLVLRPLRRRLFRR